MQKASTSLVLDFSFRVFILVSKDIAVLYLSIHLSFDLFFCPFIYLSIHPSVDLSVRVFINSSSYPFFNISVCPFIYPSIYTFNLFCSYLNYSKTLGSNDFINLYRLIHKTKIICEEQFYFQWNPHTLRAKSCLFSASIPGPVIGGKIVDQACLLWSDHVNNSGSCSFYNIHALRYNLSGLGIASRSLAIVVMSSILCFTWNMTKWPNTRDEEAEEDPEFATNRKSKPCALLMESTNHEKT